ncbi:MAG: dienelactone hydrolase family protein, partial [Planctomycetota bacterium]
MNRRLFLKIASAGIVSSSAGQGTNAQQSGKDRALPKRQSAPKSSLGSHFDNVFSKLSARCQPKLSFLNDRYDDIQAWSQMARGRLLEHIHYSPLKCDPQPEVLEKVDCGTYVREHIIINTAPDIRVTLYLLLPKDLKKPAPAIVNLHDHGAFYFWGKEKLVHVEPEHPVLTAYKQAGYGGRSTADELAKRGFVVIVSDFLNWGERGLYFEDDPERIKKRTMAVTELDIKQFNTRSWQHEELISRTALTCGVTWAGLGIWDDLRVTDYLLSRPEVDAKRIGCIGHSMGGFRSMYLGALHPAVTAS